MAVRIPPPTDITTTLAHGAFLHERQQDGSWLIELRLAGDVATALIEPNKPSDSAVYVRAAEHTERTAAMLAYSVARRARILRRRSIVLGPGSAALATSLGARRVQGTEAFGQRYDLACQRALEALPDTLRPGRDAWVAEIRETALRGIDRAFDKSFFRALDERSLSHSQYVYTLSNMHAFVRWTTRLVGRIVAASHDEIVRNEWLSHLQEEINHEKILEKDLEYLGADVVYVKSRFVPNVATRTFMAGQEALAAFASDPVVFAAAPITAEGIAAQWGVEITDSLKECIASWGYSHPQRGANFIISHAGFDGGEDGHWARTLSFVAEHLESEERLEQLLVNLHVCLDAMVEAYDSYVADVAY